MPATVAQRRFQEWVSLLRCWKKKRVAKRTVLDSNTINTPTDATPRAVATEHDTREPYTPPENEQPEIETVGPSGEVPEEASVDSSEAASGDSSTVVRTPLEHAIEEVEIRGELFMDTVRVLAAHGATIGQWDPQRLVEKCARAVTAGERDLVRVLLDNCCDPNGCEGTEGLSLLELAATAGHVEIGKLLLDRGAVIRGDQSALFFALRNNHPDFVNLLLSRESDGRCMKISGLTTGMDSEKRKEMIRILLGSGVRISVAVKSAFSALVDEAMQNGNGDLVQVLKEFGADLKIQERRNMMTHPVFTCKKGIEIAGLLMENEKAELGCSTAEASRLLFKLMNRESKAALQFLLSNSALGDLVRQNGAAYLKLTVSKSSPDMTQMLLDARVDTSTSAGSLITTAIAQQDLETLKLLLHYNADTNQTNSKGELPLCVACGCNMPTVVSLLLKSGADPNGRSDAGVTPLIAAIVGRADVALIEMLLEAGADPNAKDEVGRPVTILALFHENLKAIHALIDGGKADFRSTTADGSHLFYEATAQGLEGLVRYLLTRGAPVDLKGPRGKTALEAAVETGNGVIAKTLLDVGADVFRDGGRLAVSAVENAGLEMLKALCDAGADINQNDERGNLPLTLACQKNEPGIVKFLLEAGAVVDMTVGGGTTPLITALLANADHVLIEALLHNGAYPSATDSAGSSALHLAISGRRTEVIRLLLEHGANPSKCNAHGQTASDFARHCRFFDLARLVDRQRSLMAQERKKRRGRSSARRTNALKMTHGAQVLTKIKDTLLCPITLETMQDPVLAPDGHSYERDAITAWLQSDSRSPITRQQMHVDQLIPNRVLKLQIEACNRNAHGIGAALSCSELYKCA